MFGVLVNVIAIVGGSLLGLFLKKFFSRALGEHIEIALGFCTIVLGIKMAMKFENVLILIFCIALGGVLGYWARIEERTAYLAQKLQRVFSSKKDNNFAVGFSMTSILFCTGAMAVVGSINSGISGDHETLIAKAALDGIISISFASIYGIGVLFSSLTVLLYQGSIVLLATKLKVLASPQILNEISGVGGVLLVMIGVNLTKIKRIPVADYLPAILLVILAGLVLRG